MKNIKTNNIVKLNKTDIIQAYISELVNVKYKPLTPIEEEELFIQLKETPNNIHIKNKIINHNQRFVISVVKSYTTNPNIVLDLINEGNIGLMEAVEKFDYTQGFKFITYASWFIRKNIVYYLNSYKTQIKQTNQKINKIIKIKNKVQDKFFCESGRYANTYELIELIEKEHNLKLTKYNIEHTYPDILNNDDNITIEETQNNLIIEKINYDHKSYILNLLLDCLPELYKNIIVDYYGINCEILETNDILEKYKISFERFRSIRQMVLSKLRLFAKQNDIKMKFLPN